MLPQIIFLLLHAIVFPFVTYSWVKKLTVTVCFVPNLIISLIVISLLYWGGFFDAMPQQWIPQAIILIGEFLGILDAVMDSGKEIQADTPFKLLARFLMLNYILYAGGFYNIFIQ